MGSNYAERIFQAMKHGTEYTSNSIAEITHIDQQQTNRILRMLVKGGVVEELTGERFIKNRKFKTKQLALRV